MHQVGAGVLGPVFRGYDPEGDRAVAIKSFPLDITPEQAQVLAAELTRLAGLGLSHPSIIAPLVAGADGATAYLVEDYFVAESLDVALKQYGPAPVPDALRLIGQLAGALDFAAAAEVHHGALHPRDVLVAPHEVRLTGLGIAAAIERIGQKAPVRRPYAAPERLEGGPWGRAADVFSLACLTAELLTGRRPASPEAGVAPDLTDIQAVDPAALTEVFVRATSPPTDDRYPSALAFAAALKHALTGDPLAPPADAERSRSRRGSKPTAERVGPRLPLEQEQPPSPVPPTPSETPPIVVAPPAQEEPVPDIPPSVEAAPMPAPSDADQAPAAPAATGALERPEVSDTPAPPAEPVATPALSVESVATPDVTSPEGDRPAVPTADSDSAEGRANGGASVTSQTPSALVPAGSTPLPAFLEAYRQAVAEGPPAQTPAPETPPAAPKVVSRRSGRSAAKPARPVEAPAEVAGDTPVPEEPSVPATATARPDVTPPSPEGESASEPARVDDRPAFHGVDASAPDPSHGPAPDLPLAPAPSDAESDGQLDLQPEPPAPSSEAAPSVTGLAGGTSRGSRSRRSVGVAVGALMVGLLVGLVGGYVMWARKAAAPVSTAAAKPAPPATIGAAPRTTTEPVPSPQVEAAPGTPPASPPTTIEDSATKPGLAAAPTPSKSEAAKKRSPRAKVAPQKPTKGSPVFKGPLEVLSRPPGATVLLDGHAVGTTPLTLPSVNAGAHAVKVELQGYTSWSASVQVAAGQHNRVTASLDRRPGG